jgi:hypothetical protein
LGVNHRLKKIYVEYGAFYWCQDCFTIEIQLQAIRAYKVDIRKKGKHGDWRSRVSFGELCCRLDQEKDTDSHATLITGCVAAVVLVQDRASVEGCTTALDGEDVEAQVDTEGEGSTARETHETDQTSSARSGADRDETAAEQMTGPEEGATRVETVQPAVKAKRLRQPTLADYLPNKRGTELAKDAEAGPLTSVVGDRVQVQKRGMGVTSTRGAKARTFKRQMGKTANLRPDAATRRQQDIESYMAHQRGRREWIEEDTAAHGPDRARVTDMACILTREDSANRGS